MADHKDDDVEPERQSDEVEVGPSVSLIGNVDPSNMDGDERVALTDNDVWDLFLLIPCRCNRTVEADTTATEQTNSKEDGHGDSGYLGLGLLPPGLSSDI